MSETTPPMSKIVIQTIIKGLEESKESIQNLQAQVHSIEIAVTQMKTEGKISQETLQQLVKLIRDGNGKASLIDRINSLENQTTDIKRYIDDTKAAKSENVKGGWQLKIAIITGVLGMLGGLITTIIKLFV